MQTIERAYSDPLVRMIIHNMFVILVKRKGIKQADLAGDGTGYSLTITKHYRSVREKAGEAVKSNGKSKNAQAKLETKRAENLLRVDKKFRTYGPEDQKKEYHKRPHIEAVNSFLKTQYRMALNKVRGLKSVASYALYSILCLVLNREAAQNLGRADKAVSPTYFNT